MSASLTLFTPAGVLVRAAPLRLAARRLAAQGYVVQVDDTALKRFQRFGGADEVRLAALHRVAAEAPSIAMATRGGYGLTRLLDRLDWPLLARSVERGTRWVGYSDMTALQLGLLRHGGSESWAGPTAVDDFGRADDAGGLDDVTVACFNEAMAGELEALGFRTAPGYDGLEAAGRLWGGNLCVLMSLLGTPHWPRIRGGVLFLEDVNEQPYRVERMLLQLHQAGVLQAQKAVLLGDFSVRTKSPMDRGFSLRKAIEHVRALTSTPILTGLPFGHVATKVTLPVGRRVRLAVQGRDIFIGW
jgi:muramoyltetrapeptide carboxypeptidase